jgi:hypothetical protein
MIEQNRLFYLVLFGKFWTTSLGIPFQKCKHDDLDLLGALLEGKDEKSCPKLATHELKNYKNYKDLRQIKYLPQSPFTVQFFVSSRRWDFCTVFYKTFSFPAAEYTVSAAKSLWSLIFFCSRRWDFCIVFYKTLFYAAGYTVSGIPYFIFLVSGVQSRSEAQAPAQDFILVLGHCTRAQYTG